MHTQPAATIRVPDIRHYVTNEEFCASVFYVPVNQDGKPVSHDASPVGYEAYVVDKLPQRDQMLFNAKVWCGCIAYLTHVKKHVPYWEAVKDVQSSTIHSVHLRLKREPSKDVKAIELDTL